MNPSSPTARSATIFGVRIHVITVCDLINYVMTSAAGTRPVLIEYANVRALNMAYRQPWLKEFLNQADLVFCDGVGVIIGARMLGHVIGLNHRMTCPDYIETLAGRCASEGRSLFLLAARPGIAEKAAVMLAAKFPALKVGQYHGYFDKSGPENEKVLELLDTFRPDVLYVGFGMPIQEKWIIDNRDRLHSKVIMPLGACLDFYTGESYRGPRWLTDIGLEWLGRLLTESPKRVWGRYIIGNPLFLLRVFKEKLIDRRV